ncbi:MAG: ribosome biogenesis GTPase Der [Candidatus Methanosuratincola sp.]
MLPVVAIVGRPNVGKSALFNRLVGRRIAIVHDEPGVTRDRISAEAEWRGVRFTLVDTGGLSITPGEKISDPLLQSTVEQVRVAIDSADVIVMVVDALAGVVPLDDEVARLLRASGKRIVLAVNKVDNQKTELMLGEFTRLGLEPVFPVSALHGRGVDSLLDAVIGMLPHAEAGCDGNSAERGTPGEGGERADVVKIAIVGRPNVGKSSLVNAIIGSNRVIVSPIPGTTRDSIDVPFEVRTESGLERFVLIDTAGIRKAKSISSSVEFYSVTRAKHAIERCDIAVLVLDAETGIVELDKKIGGMITRANKGCVIAVNKWDLFEKQVQEASIRGKHSADSGRGTSGLCPVVGTGSLMDRFTAWIHEKLFFLDHAPVIFLSAKTAKNVDRLIESIRFVAGQLIQKIPTSILNRVLHSAVELRQPPSSKGERLKFFYATQTGQAPPSFVLFVNRTDLFTEPYKKYLVDQLRRSFGFEGCPIILHPRMRPRKR